MRKNIEKNFIGQEKKPYFKNQQRECLKGDWLQIPLTQTTLKNKTK